ncbi:MAG: hypothetical protein RL007_2858, partial [Bacteroidota bacterium]
MDCTTELSVLTSHAKIGFLKEKTVRSGSKFHSFFRFLKAENQANDRLRFILVNIANFERSNYEHSEAILVGDPSPENGACTLQHPELRKVETQCAIVSKVRHSEISCESGK